MRTHAVGVSSILLIFGIAAFAQPQDSRGAFTVEHSVPFGTVQGKLLVLDNYLVFVDEQQPDGSFVVPREIVDDLSTDGSTITVQTREPVRNRSGGVQRLSFRVLSGGDTAAARNWYASPGGVRTSAARTSGTAVSEEVYPARHNHRIGDCRGRLVVGPDRIAYESVSDAGHSRRWEYKSIREIKLENPYEIEMKPFAGGTYRLYLDGSGMDPAAYRAIVDRVAAARGSR